MHFVYVGIEESIFPDRLCAICEYYLFQLSRADKRSVTEFFNRRDNDAEWGIVITASMQNKGFGKEALRRMIDYGFNDLGLDRIRLEVYVTNERAFHVYQECGFKEYHRNKVDIFMDIRKEGGSK